MRAYALGSLVLSLYSSVGAGLDLDVNSSDSIKSTSKTLASSIVKLYNETLKDERVPGLFGDDYPFWQAGAVWGMLLEYSHLTGDAQFNSKIAEGMLWQQGGDNFRAFMPANQTKALANDDQAFWGLAAMTAAEVGLEMPAETDGAWIDYAVNVWETQVQRWDSEACGGGLRWQIFTFNRGWTYKNTITAGTFFLLSARLAHFTGNKTYSDWADKTLQWAQDAAFISSDFQVFDGASTDQNCSSLNRIQWSANHAIFTEGAALMYNVTNGTEKWKDAVTGFAKGLSIFQDNSTSVLVEVACEKSDKCATDQRALKGVAVRSIARASRAAPFASESLQKVIQGSAKAAAERCEGDSEDVECAFRWNAEKNGDLSDGLGEVSNALSAVQVLLWPEAKAVSRNSTTSGPSSTSPPSASGAGTSPAATGAATSLTTAKSLACIVAMLFVATL